MLNTLIPNAYQGLHELGIASSSAETYLGILRKRAECEQNGAQWQRSYFQEHAADFCAMTRSYLANQWSGFPVHEWPVC